MKTIQSNKQMKSAFLAFLVIMLAGPRCLPAATGQSESRVYIDAAGVTRVDTQNPDFDRGIEFLLAGHNREAVESLKHSLQRDPTNPQAHLNMAEAFYHLTDYQHVLEECNRAIELSNAGWVYRSRHSVKAASSDRLIRGDLASSYAKRGFAKWKLMQWAFAVEDFDVAVGLGETNNATLYLYRGHYYVNEGIFDKALPDLNAAIAVDPKMAWPYGLRGLVETKQGDDALAAADFNRAGEIDPAVREQCTRVAEGIRASRK
jgi:tetratricopeptide (TPR) repeat protein